MSVFEIYKPDTSIPGWVNFDSDTVTTEEEVSIVCESLLEHVSDFFPGIASVLGIPASDRLANEAVIDRAIKENPFGIRTFGGRYDLDSKGEIVQASFGKTAIRDGLDDVQKFDVAV